LFSGHLITFLSRPVLIKKSILDFTDPEDEGSKYLRNVGNYLPVQTMQYTNRFGSASKLMWLTSNVSNQTTYIWIRSDFDRASSLICGNKMPTRCNICFFLLKILLLAQHVSGTILPIIRSSRVLYSWLPPVVFGA
jgi:hypothetical protein